MSDCNDLIEIVRQRNEEIRELRQRVVMLEAQNGEWLHRFEDLMSSFQAVSECYLSLSDKNKRAQ